MNKLLLLTAGTLFVALSATTALAANGEELFKRHCAVCHPDGGNIIKPQHPIGKKHLAERGIKDWQGVVKVIRKPEPGMIAFDAKKLPDAEAKAIAEYVLKTFK